LTYLFLPAGTNHIDQTAQANIEPPKATPTKAEKTPRSFSHRQSPAAQRGEINSQQGIHVPERFYESLTVESLDGSCAPTTRLTLMLKLSREEVAAIKNSVKSTLLILRDHQNSIKQLKHDEDGDYYSIPPFPEGLDIHGDFVKQIKEIFPNDLEKGNFLASVLSNDPAVLNFGKYEERVAVAKSPLGDETHYIEKSLHTSDGAKLLQTRYDPQMNNDVGNSYKQFFK
jgi:hypothetical protein